MEIEAIIIFPNCARILQKKSRFHSKQVGWATKMWTLIDNNGLYWEAKIKDGRKYSIYTLSLEKKRRFASKISKQTGCRIIYLDKKRAKKIIMNLRRGMFQPIPFREKDLCR